MQFDSNGLIVTLQNDGGDTCAEESRFWFLYWFNFVFMSKYHISLKLPQRAQPSDIMNKLEIQPGIYVRNPLTSNDPSTTSRDQLKPVIWYCAAYKDHRRLLRLFKACAKRYFFAQNNQKDGKWKMPDQMWTSIGNFIRAGGYWTAILYPLLFLFDALDLLSILVYLALPFTPNDNSVWYKPWTWLTKRSLGDTDDNNTDVDLLGAVRFKPTPISFLNRVLWGKYRPINSGNTVLGYSNNCLGAIAWYHDPRNQGNIEVVWLYTAPVLKYLAPALRHLTLIGK